MTTSQAPGSRGASYEIKLPPPGVRHEQDNEWCLVRVDGTERRIRFHDYGDIYRHDGLYEQLFYDVLECSSPETVVGLLREELARASADPAGLTALDIGAGNGMVAEELAAAGIGSIVGVDIIPEAAEAAERDRPGLYDAYLVEDLTALSARARDALDEHDFTLLTCVAALGFGDIPPAAFASAYDLLPTGAWLAFCIKEDFVESNGTPRGGFAGLIRELVERGSLEVSARKRYRHRTATNGDPLHYVAFVARKAGPEPATPLVAEH